MSYRLYRREPVEAGKWYYATECSACKKLIYLLDDKSGGRATPAFLGEGMARAPCNRCLTENEFPITDLRVLQAKESLAGPKPERVPISKSSRKPLWIAYPRARPIMGVGYVEDRPKAAVIIARVITAWADVEVQMGRLLAELMGTNIPAAAAVFGSMRSSRTQNDALSAAAKVVLNEQDHELYAAYAARKAALEKERNDLTHGCFGVAVSIPDHVVWAAQQDVIEFAGKFAEDSESAVAEFRKKQFVYELGTLERIAQEIEEYHTQVSMLIGYLYARTTPLQATWRDKRYTQLCNQPHVRAALDRIQAAKIASQSPQKAKPSGKKRR